MFAERLAHLFAKSVDGVEHAGGQARLFRDFDQQACGEWGGLGRFVNDRASRSECGRDLPCGEHEGCVPRRDHPNRPDGNPCGDVHQRGRFQVLAVARLNHLICEITEILSPAQGGFGHELVGLARVPAFAKCYFFGARLNPFGHADQDLAPLGCGHIAPSGEGIGRCLGSTFNVLGPALGYVTDGAFVDG